MRAHLLPAESGFSAIELTRDLTLVGRGEGCDVRIDHKSISKHHCVIAKTDGVLLLRDLGSTNGTRVNGTRVRRAALLANDAIAIAGVQFTVMLANDLAGLGIEQTQRIDAAVVDEVLARSQTTESTEDDGPADPSQPPVKANALPDVYTDSNSFVV